MSYKYIGSATTPLEIAKLLQRRRYELGISGETLSNIAGLADRHLSKIECGSKGLGTMSLPTLLSALGCQLILVANNEMLPRIVSKNIGSTKYKYKKILSEKDTGLRFELCEVIKN